MKNIKIFLTIVILCYFYSEPRYIKILPTLPFAYPNSLDESVNVLYFKENASNELVNLFYKTDKSIVYAFEHIIPNKTLSELNQEVLEYKVLFPIIFFKYSINRARPWQVNKKIQKLESKTDTTPSFPAGHAFQAYYLAKKYGEIYPELEEKLLDIAKKCHECRIAAGIHYPSDGKFSKQLVDFLY